MVRSYLVNNNLRPYGSWPLGSAVETEVRRAIACVDHYMHLMRKHSSRTDTSGNERDDAWESVVESVSAIIDRAEEIKGGRISPRA